VLVVAIERIGDMDARAEAEADVAIEWIGMRAGEMEANENSEVSAVDGRPLPVRDISMKAGRGLEPVGQALWDKLLNCLH
jgi:hypothetical protein